MIGGIATTASARAYARRSRQSAVMFERGAPSLRFMTDVVAFLKAEFRGGFLADPGGRPPEPTRLAISVLYIYATEGMAP